MRRSLALLAAATLVLAACGDDDSSDDADATSATPAATEADDSTDEPSSPPTTGTEGDTANDAATDDTGADDDSSSDGGESDDVGDSVEASGSASGDGFGSGSATLTLANGESFEFSTLCALEPQEAAGSEILYTVVSNDNPGLDITQFGDEGAVTDFGVISVIDGSTFETLWEASSLNETFGGSFSLQLDGSTITGGGSFYPAGDIALDPVEGEVVATC